MTCTQRTIRAGSPAHHAHMDELCELVARNGFDPHDVRAVTFDVIDAPLLSVELYERDSDGRLRAIRDETTVRPATHFEDRLLSGSLPDWWQPGASPKGKT